MIENNYFTVLPAGRKSVFLAELYRQLLLNNLQEYLRAIQNFIPEMDISFLEKKCLSFNSKKNFSPTLYSIFSGLTRAINQNNITLVTDVLHQINILKEEDIYDAQFRISTILTENWERDFVHKLRTEGIPSEEQAPTIILPILNPDLSEVMNVYQSTVEKIGMIDPDFYQEILNYVTRVKLFNGIGLTASTSAAVFGAIYLCLPDTGEKKDLYFFEHIIHETSHLQLEILFAFDKIVMNLPTDTYKSPLRKDPRPMLGIFHATFVLSRMVRMFRKAVKENLYNGLQPKLELLTTQFHQGLDTINKHALLTERGNLIRESLMVEAN